MDHRDERADQLAEIESIYRSRLPELRRVAAAVSGSREMAADLVQDAFVRAVRRLDSFRGDGPLEGWLWRIVVNVARNGHRSAKSVALPDEAHLQAKDAADAAIARAEQAAAISLLPERERLVLFLRYYADLDYRAIGEALSISSGTVGATLTTARAKLAKALELEEASGD